MMRRSRIGTAAGLASALFVVAAFTAPSGAQQPPVQKDTAKQVAEAAPDTMFQTAGMQEFEARRKLGIGYYLTRRQLRKERDRSLGDIVMAHIPGLRTVYGIHRNSLNLVSTRGEGPHALVSTTGPALCYVQVFVDGSYIIDGDISWINPDNVEGVEFYDATRTPPAYRRPSGECGVLLVWSRTGGN